MCRLGRRGPQAFNKKILDRQLTTKQYIKNSIIFIIIPEHGDMCRLAGGWEGGRGLRLQGEEERGQGVRPVKMVVTMVVMVVKIVVMVVMN